MSAAALPETALESAHAAGLRYVTDQMPGIRREKCGEHFIYIGVDGAEITNEKELARIKSLAVPPAYHDVWICPIANGHMQATARDDRGRKQYRYHKRWREIRDDTKYGRMIALARALPKIRKRLDSDLALPGLPYEKVLATVVSLLQSTAIRIGNEEYAKENRSYGLTTLQNRHAKVKGSNIRFTFKGKRGVRHAIDLRDRRLAKTILRCQDLPGQQLFQYLDDDGATRTIDSADVNAYIQDIAGEDFSAKDFRTWLGSVTCAMLLAEQNEPASSSERTQQIAAAIKDVAKRLGNTPAICRKCYVHPDVIQTYIEEGCLQLKRAGSKIRGLEPEELFLLALLLERERDHRVRFEVVGPKTVAVVRERDRGKRR